MRKEKVLDKLVDNGYIKSYVLETEELEPGFGSRETDKLTLTFESGFVLIIKTFCSGIAENTVLYFEE